MVAGVITSELYVCLVKRLWMSYRDSASPLQAARRSLIKTDKRGACPFGRYDGMSRGKSRQNGVVARYRGILRLADCFEFLRPISFAYGCAYARHTPHARRDATHTYPSRAAGWCPWLVVLRLVLTRDRAAAPTQKYSSSGAGVAARRSESVGDRMKGWRRPATQKFLASGVGVAVRWCGLVGDRGNGGGQPHTHT